MAEAITRYGILEIFNTDQGCQFTSDEFTGLLHRHGIQISMDGRGRSVDNVFGKRLWKSVKYENVYLHAYGSASELTAGLDKYFTFYNQRRPHRSLEGQTPDAVYFERLPALQQAA